MHEAIATRVLTCTIAGKTEEVVVSFGRPVQEAAYMVTCEYEIQMSGNTVAYSIAGIDGV